MSSTDNERKKKKLPKISLEKSLTVCSSDWRHQILPIKILDKLSTCKYLFINL